MQDFVHQQYQPLGSGLLGFETLSSDPWVEGRGRLAWRGLGFSLSGRVGALDVPNPKP